MPAPQGPTSLNLSGIVDGTNIDAADVTVPLAQAATAIDEARTTLRVKSTDTVLQYLADALTAGAGITLTQSTVTGATTIAIASTGIATGMVLPYFGKGSSIPTGFALCNGALVSMGSASSQTYEALLDLLLDATTYYSTTVLTAFGLNTGNTVTADAGTDKVLWASHTLVNGDRVVFGNSGGALPGGISANTKYFVRNAGTNDFQISLTSTGAIVDISSAGTGTHTVYWQFALPDLRGRTISGLDAMLTGASANRVTASAADAIGGSVGAETHTIAEGELPSHSHSLTIAGRDGVGNSFARLAATHSTTGTTGNYTGTSGTTGSGTAHNNMQPTMFACAIIKL